MSNGIKFKKQSLIDYAVELDGKHIGWINKIYLNEKNSGDYYYTVRINHPDGSYLMESPWKLSEAKDIIRKFVEAK